jgi:hypothetical protein
MIQNNVITVANHLRHLPLKVTSKQDKSCNGSQDSRRSETPPRRGFKVMSLLSPQMPKITRI